MARNPLEFMADAPLFVVPRMLERLRAWRDSPKPECGPLAVELDDLVTRLLAGIEAHPTKFWVMKQFRRSLASLPADDAEARSRLGAELEALMGILGIARSDGTLE